MLDAVAEMATSPLSSHEFEEVAAFPDAFPTQPVNPPNETPLRPARVAKSKGKRKAEY